MPTPAVLFGSILFSAIGLGAFLYGKKGALWTPAIIGIVLMVYPYFVSETWILFAVGSGLCAALYFFRD